VKPRKAGVPPLELDEDSVDELALGGGGEGVNSGVDDDELELELELDDVANGSDSQLVGSSA
jgi:hypothetical protein